MGNKFASALAVLVGMSGFAGVAARGADVLSFTSSPGSWIGQGMTVSVPVTGSQRVNDLPPSYTNELEFLAPGYFLDLVGPNESLLTVGYYPNVARTAFNGGKPGLSLTTGTRGDNEDTGWMDVLQADYNPDGTVQAFAIDFRQNDEGVVTNWTQGSLRYNSSIPVPEPGIFVAVVGGAALLTRRRSTT